MERRPFETLESAVEMQFLALYISLTALAVKINAAPTTLDLQGRSVTPLSPSELTSLAPFTQFARAAYCPTNVLQSWSCGRGCFSPLYTTKLLIIVVNC
jgi:hypothetical protein